MSVPIVIGLLLVLVYFYIQKGEADNYQTVLNEIVSNYGNEIKRAGNIFHISSARIAGIIGVESAGDPNAVGSIGEVGLMQVTPQALSDYNTRYIHSVRMEQLPGDETLQIFVGSGYLALLNERLHDIDKATRAYNSGESNVRKSTAVGFEYLQKVKEFEQYYPLV